MTFPWQVNRLVPSLIKPAIYNKQRKELFEEKKAKRKETYINSIVFDAKIAVRGDAAVALVALRSVQGDDVIAGSDVGDARSDALNHSGAFVAQDAGEDVRASSTLLEINVRMANTRRSDLDPHLSGFRHGHLNRLHFQWLVDSPRHSRSALNNLSLFVLF